MGYFSELVIDNEYYEDYSFPSPEMEWRWRIEDLKNRLEETANGNYGITAHYFMGCQFSREDLAYTPSEYFSRASDILAAISIAEEKIAIAEAKELTAEINDEVEKYQDERIPGQLTIWDILVTERPDLSESELEIAA